MKKTLLLLLFTAASYGQAVFDEGIQIKNNTTDNTATKVNVQSTDGTINTISKADLVNVVEVNDVPSLPLIGEAGKIYVVKNINKIYRWNGTFYQELAVTDITYQSIIDALGFTPENVVNKQNSLAVDGTGIKYPTVDAVNVFKNSLGSAAYKNAGTNDGDVPILYRSPSGEPQIRFSGNGINVLSLKNTSPTTEAYSVLAFSEPGSDVNAKEKAAVGVGKSNSAIYPWRSVYLESFAPEGDNNLLPIRLVQSTSVSLNYKNWRRIDIEGSGVTPGDISFYSGTGLNYPNETAIFKMFNNGDAYINRHLGIGTISPSSPLTVYTASGGLLGQIRMGFSDSASWTIGRETDVDGRFTITKGTDSVEKLSISPIGVVRINDLSGVGTRTVTADASGNLSAPTNLVQSGTITASPATVDTQLATLGQAKAVARPYKVYTALLSQSGTNAPVATVLENTLGGTVVWNRNATGHYLGVVSTSLNIDKTACFATPSSVYNISAAMVPSGVNISIDTALNGSLTDGLLNKASIEIRVYN